MDFDVFNKLENGGNVPHSELNYVRYPYNMILRFIAKLKKKR